MLHLFVMVKYTYLVTYAYTVEGKGSDVVIFKNSILTLSLTLYTYASYKQLSYTVPKQPSTAINFKKFFQKTWVLESFF